MRYEPEFQNRVDWIDRGDARNRMANLTLLHLKRATEMYGCFQYRT